MLKFKEFLAEMFLLEGKIDDLKAQNPSLHREIDRYTDADPSPTKKFVPWLVSQHKRGNVTPDHPDLHLVLGNYDRYKNIHSIKDHSSKTFQEVHSTIMPLIGTGSTKAEIANQGHVKIHDSGDVQTYHVANKEASQKFYGGGPKAGPTNTTWCVSARSEDCLYEKSAYGKLYTIHVKGDPDSPYAVHPGHKNKISGSITNRHNDGDNEIDNELKSNPKIAKLKPAIDAIRKHYDPLAFRLTNDHDLTKDEIDTAMSSSKYQKHLLKNSHSQVALAALNHPKADYETTWNAAQHHDPKVALAALNHPKADYETTWNAAQHHDPRVVMAALNHPEADHWTTWNAAQHHDPKVALAALNHPKANSRTTHLVAQHHDPKVAMAALNDAKADIPTTRYAAQHHDPKVALAALNHPKANYRTTLYAAKHQNPQVAMAALNRPKVNSEIIQYAAKHQDPQVRAKAQELMRKFK